MAEKHNPDAAATRLDGSPPAPFCAHCGTALPVEGSRCLKCGDEIARIPAPFPINQGGSGGETGVRNVPVAVPHRRVPLETLLETVEGMARDPEDANERRYLKILILSIPVIIVTVYILDKIFH